MSLLAVLCFPELCALVVMMFKCSIDIYKGETNWN